MTYDFIEKEQIKCFYTPLYNYNNEENKIIYTFGQNRIFNIGDNIPSQTFWYNYSDNFMILDYEYSKINPLVHIVENSRIKKTILMNQLTFIDFLNNEKVINHNGEELKINSIESLNLFMNDVVELDGMYEFKHSKSSIYMDNLLRRNKDIQLINTNSAHCLFCLSELDREAVYNILINYENNTFPVSLPNALEVVGAYKQDIANNQELINKIKDIVLKRLKEEFDILYSENEKIEYEINKEMEELEKVHKNKWFDFRFEKEKKFGEYLECYRYLKSSLNLLEEDSSLKLELDDCMYNFSNYIKQNEDIFDKYLKWSNFDSDVQEILKNIIDDILNEKIEC